MKFRKKPVIIDAIKWHRNPKIAVGYDEYGVEYTVCDTGIQTLEGFLKINDGDYLITGVKGEKYACKPDIFELTYEKVEE